MLRERNSLKVSLLKKASSAVRHIYSRHRQTKTDANSLSGNCKSLDCLDLSVGSLLRSLSENNLVTLLSSKPDMDRLETLTSLQERFSDVNIKALAGNSNGHFNGQICGYPGGHDSSENFSKSECLALKLSPLSPFLQC